MKREMVSDLSDEQLAAAVNEALDALTPRARAHALAVAGGKPSATAARELGTSTNPRVLARMKARTRSAVALLHEQHRRQSHLTAESAARWFEDVAAEARRAKDYGAATRAKREAALLLGLFPDPHLRVDHTLVDARGITPEELEAAARFVHDRPRLAARTIDADFTSIEPKVTPALEKASPQPPQAGDIAGRALSLDAISPAEEVLG